MGAPYVRRHLALLSINDGAVMTNTATKQGNSWILGLIVGVAILVAVVWFVVAVIVNIATGGSDPQSKAYAVCSDTWNASLQDGSVNAFDLETRELGDDAYMFVTTGDDVDGKYELRCTAVKNDAGEWLVDSARKTAQ